MSYTSSTSPTVTSTTVSGQPVLTPLPVADYPFVSEVETFLEKQFLTPELDELSPKLWLVATPKGSHISSFHRQLVRGREIVITEKGRLHLVWHRNQVFIKPLPSYLLDDAFQQRYIASNKQLSLSIAGFLRSYTHLLQSPSDLSIALEKKLLPQTLIEEISDSRTRLAAQNRLFTFLRRYKTLADDEVSRRYRYGDLRLGRINFYNRLFRFEMVYHKVYDQYGTYFGRFMEPFLFVFGTASVLLSAMQVVLAATERASSEGWDTLASVSMWFSVGCIAAVTAVIYGLATVFLVLVLRELIYALVSISRQRRKTKGRGEGDP